MKPCYSKELAYIIPNIHCSFCTKQLMPGNALYTVVITWGDGRTACKECYDEYKVDWSLHETDETDEEED